MEESKKWECPKCQNSTCQTDEIAATGTGLTKFMNMQNRKFVAITCDRCKYTEFYKGESSMLSNILDILGN
ncbi:GTP-binding protein [Candidatus Poribacteria bacterium]|nr:GTP-binding protein [Candidatus Poribacteria bacterium]